MNNEKFDELIKWCRFKITQLHKGFHSSKYEQGYEDAMKAVMSKLHSEKVNTNGR